MVYFTPSASKFRSGMKRSRRGRRKLKRRYSSRPMTTSRVVRIIDAELKFRDLSVGPQPIPSVTGAVSPISNIAQGDLVNQRNGNWIKPVTFYGTVTIVGNTAQALTTSLYRIIVVQWKENEVANPVTLANIMQDTSDPHQGFRV